LFLSKTISSSFSTPIKSCFSWLAVGEDIVISSLTSASLFTNGWSLKKLWTIFYSSSDCYKSGLKSSSIFMSESYQTVFP
jgi:hypothetical protein